MLIVRLGAMGDILHALPAITALRRAQPEWYLGWAVEPQWRSLLAAHENAVRGPEMPLVDCLHVVPAKRWARNPFAGTTLAEISAMRRELRAAEYDVCIDLQGAVRSALIARAASPKRLIGEAAPREWAAKYLFGERVATHGVHVIEQAAEVASAAAGVRLEPVQPWLPHDAAAERWCERSLPPGRLVVLNPGAGWGAKRWPSARYAEVARELAARGMVVVANAGPGEEGLAQEVASSSGGAALALTPTLNELIALVRRSALVIAGDTGPLHLACAVGKPVVGIFGPTDPARNGPFGCANRVLRHPESRRDHTRRAEPETGLLTITPAAVLAAADELLKENA